MKHVVIAIALASMGPLAFAQAQTNTPGNLVNEAPTGAGEAAAGSAATSGAGGAAAATGAAVGGVTAATAAVAAVAIGAAVAVASDDDEGTPATGGSGT